MPFALRSHLASSLSPPLRVGTRAELDTMLAQYALAITETADPLDVTRLAHHLETLSTRALHGGIVEDEWSGRKYATRPHHVGLLGGGNQMTTASKVDDYAVLKASCCGPDRVRVERTLTVYQKARAVDRTSRVVIENKSPYSLELKAHGSSNGYFFSDAAHAFGDANATIAPGHSGGFLHSKASNAWIGCIGYVSFRVPVEGRNYIVCIGFGTVYAGANRAGIEIRVEDGSADEHGHIATHGHGVDATGAVTDIDALTHHYHAVHNEPYHFFFETTRAFTARCSFTNAEQAEFRFEVIATST